MEVVLRALVQQHGLHRRMAEELQVPATVRQLRAVDGCASIRFFTELCTRWRKEGEGM